MRTIITVENLVKQFSVQKRTGGLKGAWKDLFTRNKETVLAVDHLSFTLQAGEFVGFLGPNGAGKTTTLKMLSGILTPSSGQATVLGHVPWRRENDFKRSIALTMGQKSQLWWDLPARETFLLNKEIYGVSDQIFKNRLTELIELLKVGDIIDRPVRQLSLGQRMKCELIASLIHGPQVVFLDEPTIGLDIESQRAVQSFLKKYNRENAVTMLLTSHNMEDIKELCARLVIINYGKIIYDGTYAELSRRFSPAKDIEISTTKVLKKMDLQALGMIRSFDSHRVVLAVPRQQVASVTAELMRRYEPEDIAIREPEATEVIADLFRSND